MASRKVQAKISKMIRKAGPLLGSGMGRRTEKAVGFSGKKFKSISRAAANDRVSNYLNMARFKKNPFFSKKDPAIRAGRMAAANDIRNARSPHVARG